MNLPLGGFTECRNSYRNGLKPEPTLTVSEWAEQFRYIADGASSDPGKWRNSRTPYLVEVMDCLSPSHPAKEVGFMAGAQMGKSESGNNWIASMVDQAPGPMLAVLPNEGVAKNFSRQRLKPTFEATPRIRGKISEAKSRDSANTILYKEFKGGWLALTGANAAAGLRSMPVRYLLLEEVDGYPVDVDGEGDPMELALKRTRTFPNRKVYVPSTPTDKSTSRIWSLWERSDQRRRYLPCPHCGHMQTLEWEAIKFDYDPGTYRLIGQPKLKCTGCGRLIDEHHKPAMEAAGEWRATRPEIKDVVCFWLSGLHSLSEDGSWTACVKEFLEARKKRSKAKLKTWVNTVLGKPWEDDEEEAAPWQELKRRAEDLSILPQEACVLTAGVDVQDDRLEVTVEAWGDGEENWKVEHRIIHGDPARKQVWTDLDDLLFKSTWPHASGRQLRIVASCIDTGGHHTARVYDYVRPRQGRRVFGIKGSSQEGRPIIDKPSMRNKGRIKLFPIGTDTAKEEIFYRLRIEEPGPGAIHFSNKLTDEYYLGLTSERLARRYVKGKEKREWVKVRERNEPLDCAVYARAAMEIVDPKFKQIQAALTPVEPDPVDALKPKPTRHKKVRRSGWL